MSTMLEYNGELARRAIDRAGGKVTYDEYATLMRDEKYFIPLHWGGAAVLKRNHDKLCVLQAIKMGIVVPFDGGYMTKGLPQ